MPPAAAKSMAVKRPADTESPDSKDTDDTQSPPSKRIMSDEQRRINNAHSKVKRIAEGKIQGSEEAVAHCKMAMGFYKDLAGRDDKLEFAKKVEGSAKNKNYGWIRTFRESLKSQKTSSESFVENYHTRNAIIINLHCMNSQTPGIHCDVNDMVIIYFLRECCGFYSMKSNKEAGDGNQGPWC